MSLLDERRLVLGLLLCGILGHSLCHILPCELITLCLIVLIERHIIVADEVIALLSAALGGLAVAPLQPGEHTLADVYAAVIDDIRLHNLVAIGLHNLRQRPSEQVIAHVTQVKRLVRIGR